MWLVFLLDSIGQDERNKVQVLWHTGVKKGSTEEVMFESQRMNEDIVR